MLPRMRDDEAIQLWRAIVSEIKAEMGRQDMSSRGLARRLDTNPQYVTYRLNGGNPKTGELVILDVRDLSAMARVLGLTEVELIERAERAVELSRSMIPASARTERAAKLDEIKGRKRSRSSIG